MVIIIPKLGTSSLFSTSGESTYLQSGDYVYTQVESINVNYLVSNQVSNIQISNQTDQRGPTLRNLVDLGAASGANIALTDHNDDDEDDLQDETN